MPCNYKDYPANWKEIRATALNRANHQCQFCGLPNHAVGYRDAAGRFVPNRGNIHCDASGRGQHPNGTLLTHAEAKEFTDQYNDCVIGQKRCDDDGNHWIVIVLTMAHLDHDIQNNAPENLKALCQRCHIRHDARHHAKNAKATRDRKCGQADMLEYYI